MDVRYLPDKVRFERMNTEEVRKDFLVEGLFAPGLCEMVYCHSDRSIVGSAVPVDVPVVLETSSELASGYFAENRELGTLNIGGAGVIAVDGENYEMSPHDILYIGRGSRNIEFRSDDSSNPARFYFVSFPAHTSYLTARMSIHEAEPLPLGKPEDVNVRTIYKYIHKGGIRSCQLVMGWTKLEEGSVWNTMPAHTHERRSEIYMYFGLDENARVFHLMGMPDETRHIIMKNGEAVLSPSWSIHSGVGTSNYSFCWAMGGENQEFADQDWIDMDSLA
ncbi:MAG: 5-dehydro-4-deoxy-D-glucuronate isomerase [Armatimonadetes bacterium]|nr:5-dehydro-4-deoxy-D-glucuronate isomerase [Armatimonadota bacterium]